MCRLRSCAADMAARKAALQEELQRLQSMRERLECMVGQSDHAKAKAAEEALAVVLDEVHRTHQKLATLVRCSHAGAIVMYMHVNPVRRSCMRYGAVHFLAPFVRCRASQDA